MDTDTLLQQIRSGDRRALARALTLVESTHAEDRLQADDLLQRAAVCTGQSSRVGISGVPGVGKSTLIEALGMHLVEQGHRVAVLAVDPSSTVSGGSILADKTRMQRLAAHDSAFVRPTPSAGVLGGVARQTQGAILLCEAAGYDVILVETVGVGQSEVSVASMTDLLLLLLLPNAGDDLQAIKRGIMEQADVIAINKADIDSTAARQAASLVLRHDVCCVSALTGAGVAELWQVIRQQLAKRSRQPVVPSVDDRPFTILGLQQIAIGSRDKQRLRHLWVDLLGLSVSGHYKNARENVDEDICQLSGIEVDLMQPIDPEKKPAVHEPALNHVGLWVDNLPAAVSWLTARGLRFTDGGIRKGAGGHDVCFIHPKSAEGVLIELVQAPGIRK
jgi:LAO/AO transport system ATPase/methylmalonyl-CoA epimerase